jgi:hypothetical protein
MRVRSVSLDERGVAMELGHVECGSGPEFWNWSNTCFRLLEDLAALQAHGMIQTVFLPGMYTTRNVRVLNVVHDGQPGLTEVIDDEGRSEWHHFGVIGAPDINDDATVGCLRALYRKATKSPRAYAMFSVVAAA